MKTKITSVLAIFATSVFAFAADPAAEAPAPVAAPAPVVAPAPQKTPAQYRAEMRDVFVSRILLSLKDEDLAKLAEKISEVQKLTPEQRANALKALPPLPKPQVGFKGPKGQKWAKGPKGQKGSKCCMGKSGPKGQKWGKGPGGRKGKKWGKAPRCPKNGAPLPPPSAQEIPAVPTAE